LDADRATDGANERVRDAEASIKIAEAKALATDAKLLMAEARAIVSDSKAREADSKTATMEAKVKEAEDKVSQAHASILAAERKTGKAEAQTTIAKEEAVKAATDAAAVRTQLNKLWGIVGWLTEKYAKAEYNRAFNYDLLISAEGQVDALQDAVATMKSEQERAKVVETFQEEMREAIRVATQPPHGSPQPTQ
jgi:hypothetical protein